MSKPRKPKGAGKSRKKSEGVSKGAPVDPVEVTEEQYEYLAKFTPRQQEIIRIAHRYRGISQAQIGAILGMTRQSVNEHFSSAELQKVLAFLSKDIYGRMEGLRDLAADHYEATLKDPNADPWIKYNISRDILAGVLQSRHFLPKPAIVEDLLIVDESRPDLPGEKL